MRFDVNRNKKGVSDQLTPLFKKYVCTLLYYNQFSYNPVD